MPSAADCSFSEIKENSQFFQIYTITPAVYDALVLVFGDQSPIHVDQDYAKAAGFSNCVMHGAVLQGFLSHFVGMHFPGKRALLLSVNMNYHHPSYLNDEIELKATVRQKVDAAKVVVLDVEFMNTETKSRVASGRAQVAIRDA